MSDDNTPTPEKRFYLLVSDVTPGDANRSLRWNSLEKHLRIHGFTIERVEAVAAKNKRRKTHER